MAEKPSAARRGDHNEPEAASPAVVPSATPMFVEPAPAPSRPRETSADAEGPAEPAKRTKRAPRTAEADSTPQESVAEEISRAVDDAAGSAPVDEADREKPSADPSRDDESEQGEGTSRPTRILVAEDEALIRLDLAEMLTEAGYDVVGQASDGQQAVELAEELRPDMVIMDVKMPRLDGISAAERIGEAGIAPVVMLTAFSDRQLVDRARDAGVMAYVIKPFTINDLAPALSIARSRWQERQALEAEVADLQQRFETRKKLDRAKGLLQSQLGLDEAGAFRWIQKAAMDRRMSMREVAEAVITGVDKPKR